MAGVNALITHGIGPGSSILFVLTGGLAIGDAPPPPPPVTQAPPSGGWTRPGPRAYDLRLSDGSTVRVKNRGEALRLIAEYIAEDAPQAVQPSAKRGKGRRATWARGGQPEPPQTIFRLLPEMVAEIDAMARAAEELRIEALIARGVTIRRREIARDDEAILLILAQII